MSIVELNPTMTAIVTRNLIVLVSRASNEKSEACLDVSHHAGEASAAAHFCFCAIWMVKAGGRSDSFLNPCEIANPERKRIETTRWREGPRWA